MSWALNKIFIERSPNNAASLWLLLAVIIGIQDGQIEAINEVSDSERQNCFSKARFIVSMTTARVLKLACTDTMTYSSYHHA